MAKKILKTNNGKKGGLLEGKPHYDKDGKPLGGIKAIVTDTNQIVELEGGEVIINKEASKLHWKELSRINQSAGNGVPILPPDEVLADVDEYKKGGNLIKFNPNKLPAKWLYEYALKIKKNYPEVWDLGGNIYGNTAFENLERVLKRGYWKDSEEWFFVKWQSFNARHKGDFLIAGVIANLKWLNVVEKGWKYMKNLIEEEIEKRYDKKMATGGGVDRQLETEQLRLSVKTKKLKRLQEELKNAQRNGNTKKIEQILKDIKEAEKMATGGNLGIGSNITFYDKYYEKNREGTIISKLREGEYEVGTSIGTKLVKEDEIIGLTEKQPSKSWWQFENGGGVDAKELAMGIKAEQEHKDTYKKIYDHEITPEQAPKQVAIDHLKEFDDYYTRLAKMEGMKSGGKVAEVIREYKEGKLKTSNGEKVTDYKQALAIGLSEQRRHEDKLDLGGSITCSNCGHSWHKQNNHTTKVEVCHLCGNDNTVKEPQIISLYEINKATKMEKSDIFYNPDIFVEEADFVLGGFVANALNSIQVKGSKNMLDKAKLEYLFEKRLKTAIDEYKQEIKINLVNSGRDLTREEIEMEINADIRVRLETYLSIKTFDFSTENLFDLITSDSSYQTWSEKIINRAKAYMSQRTVQPSDVVSDKKGKVSVSRAEELTENISFEAILEMLGNINENNTY